jgi:hypothetical protein
MSNPYDSKIVFREVQRFQARPRGLLTLVPLAALAGALVFFASTRGTSDQVLGGVIGPAGLAVGVGCMVFFGVAVLISLARLVTEVRRDGLFIQFYPFERSFQRIPLRALDRLDTITYRPILDYGGRGIRYGRKGKAYTVSGNRGVVLTFVRGRSLLIGSQRCEDLALALEQLLEKPKGGRPS